MARLLGYSSKAVGAALERLESQGLILRSRNSGGARFYQLAAGEAPAADESCLGRLMSVAETRPGRLMLMKLMGRNDERHIAGNERSK
jgi:DNA-binding transcriptional regulator PaaX